MTRGATVTGRYGDLDMRRTKDALPVPTAAGTSLFSCEEKK